MKVQRQVSSTPTICSSVNLARFILQMTGLYQLVEIVRGRSVAM